MILVEFAIPGAPRTKKTSNRIVRVGKFSKILPSKAYEAWNKNAQVYLLSAARRVWVTRPLGIGVPVNCRALFYRDAERGDAVGYYQALADTLEHARIVMDDKFIVSWDGSRLLKDARCPRIEFVLESIG